MLIIQQKNRGELETRNRTKIVFLAETGLSFIVHEQPISCVFHNRLKKLFRSFSIYFVHFLTEQYFVKYNNDLLKKILAQ